MIRFLFTMMVAMLAPATLFAASEDVVIGCSWGDIAATLAVPEGGSESAVLIVAGSGPTDRNGNSGLNLNTYAYKLLSDGLVEAGYAVLRYDKRGIGGSYLPAEQIPALLYDDYVDDAERCVAWLRERGIREIILDPGFGFSKSLEQNYELLSGVHCLTELGCPVLVGVSRKSMIYRALGITPAEALNGTTALHWEALRQGASILRVHDVREAQQTIRLFEQYRKGALR
jgi:hypothetical protein